MKVRIKINAYVFTSNNGYTNKLRDWLKEKEGKLIAIDTDHLFNNQYNTRQYIDKAGELQPGFRIYDSMISEIIADERPGKGKCNYCGKMVNKEDTKVCTKHVECITYKISWFTPDNTYFLKHPKGISQIPRKILSIDKDHIKIGTYYLESYPNLDYFRLKNCRKTINFKFDGEKYYVQNGIGYTEARRLDVPYSIQAKIKSKLIELINN
jgi:hypothetical protein